MTNLAFQCLLIPQYFQLNLSQRNTFQLLSKADFQALKIALFSPENVSEIPY